MRDFLLAVFGRARKERGFSSSLFYSFFPKQDFLGEGKSGVPIARQTLPLSSATHTARGGWADFWTRDEDLFFLGGGIGDDGVDPFFLPVFPF